MNLPKIHIYISCHKKCYVPKFSFLRPIQVGSEIATEQLEMLHDNKGQNISKKNKTYCELTAQYWAWKNDLDADYYGFWHYRRYMSFSEGELPHNRFEDVELPFLDTEAINILGISEENVNKYVQKYDVIATTPVNLKKLSKRLKSNRHQYSLNDFQFEEDLDIILDIIKEKYPDYYDVANYYFDESPVGYYCNMFIMRKELFQKYSEWLFSILAEFELRKDFSDYNVESYRVCGYLGERLFGVYYLWLKKQTAYKTFEVQRCLFANVENQDNIAPAFKINNIPVVLAANNFFIPYLAVTLKSIIDNSNCENNYDILILSSDCSERNKSLLQILVKESSCQYKNFSLRFINPEFLLQNFTPYLHGHFGYIETYYRLLLPQLLLNYDKVLYLDSDMLVQADVAELYNTKLGNYLIAACKDADSAGLYNGYELSKKKYIDYVLKLKNPYKYFQAGTILFNLNEFRKTYSFEEILKFAAKEKWQLQDQDVLNKLCEDKVLYVDMSWNVMVDLYDIRIRNIISKAPHYLAEEYAVARKNPRIVHYAGPQKPWISPEMDFGWLFWFYARKTPFYEILIKRMDGLPVRRLQRNKNIKSLFALIKGGFNCVLDNGIIYTIKYLAKRLFVEKKYE